MTDLTKLADELRAAAYKAPDRATSRAMFEAAHIIRSAASLDMTGFMAMHDAAAEARRVLVSGGNVPQAEADRSRLSRAALESALRMALAAREWQPIETAPKDGTRILLGRAPDLDENGEPRPGEVAEGYWQEGYEDGPDIMGHDDCWTDSRFEIFSYPRSFGSEKYRTAGYQPTHYMPLPAAPKGTP